MKWEKVKLGEVLDNIVGGGTPSKLNLNYWSGNIYWCSVKDMSFDTHYLSSTKDTITEEGLKNSTSNLIKQGTVITATRMGLGRAFINKVDMAINQDLKALIPNKKIDNLFLLWTIIYKREEILSMGRGATVNGITLDMLTDIQITLPPLDIQRKIANTMSMYDDLIENNQKQIKLLEEAAQRLYKEWFVDFRFPGYENAKFIDGIPEGWKKEPVGSIIDNISRKKQIKATDYLDVGAIPIVDQGKIFIAGYTNDNEAIINIKKPVIVFGDHTRILKYVQFPFAKGADGTQLIVSNKTNMPQSLFYCSLIAVDLSNYHYARHFKYLKAETILVPTKDIADRFDVLVAPVFYMIQNLRDISSKLTQARDRLLPKLMSGEIEV